MAGLIIGKRDGRWFFTAKGCCDTTATQAMYDRHHALHPPMPALHFAHRENPSTSPPNHLLCRE